MASIQAPIGKSRSRRTKLSRFKFRNARLMTAIVALVAIVVDSGAAHKF